MSGAVPGAGPGVGTAPVAAGSPVPLQRFLYGALAVFLAVLWFATLSSRPLFNPDEGRYAEIPREMLSGGDWIIPHLNGLAYIEKPPLQYWATALSLRVFGHNEFAARAYTALCAVLAVLVVAFVARRLWGPATAWCAGALLGSSLLFVVLGQLLTLDMSLTFYMTVALGGFLLAQPSAYGGEPRRALRPAMLVAWLALALGVMTKGLVAAAIPAAVLVLYSLYAWDFSPWRRLELGPGLALFLVVAVPWHWLAARREPDFLQFFFVHEHLARYLTPSADREEPWWYFGVVFVLGCMPWSVTALRALATGWQRPGWRRPGVRRPGNGAARQFHPALFLRLWVLFVIVFFSLSDSKLIPYILPALPALALLMAASPAAALRREVAFAAAASVLAALLLGALCGAAPRLLAGNERREYFLALVPSLLQVALLLGVSGLFVLAQRRRGTTHGAVFLGAGWCLAGLLLMRAAGLVAPIYSGTVLARAGMNLVGAAPVYSVATYDQTLPFYWQRTVQLVAYRGELDFGLRRSPDAPLAAVGDFVERWGRPGQAYAVMEIPLYDELVARGVSLREVARDVHRVLVARQ